MTGESSSISTDRSSDKRRRLYFRRILVTLAIILFLLGGWWWFTRPKTYRLVCRLPCYYGNVFNNGPSPDYRKQGAMPCLAGFCLREDECVISLRDWNTGQVKWRVTTAKPSAAEWPSASRDGFNDCYRAGISPNGRFLTVMTAAGSYARIQSWRDGVFIGEVRVKCELVQNASFYIATRDNGQSIFIIDYYARAKRSSMAYLIENSKITAQGKLPCPFELSPDGKSGFDFVSDSIYAVVIQDGRIFLSSPVKLKKRIGNDITLGTNGTALDNEGNIYRLSRQHTALPGDWGLVAVSTSGRYAAFSSDNRVRALDAETGNWWDIVVPSRWVDSGYATEDGKHILILYSSRESAIEELLWRYVKPLARCLPDDRYWLVLYQRPHREIVRLCVKDDYEKPLSRETFNSTNQSFSWWPSPDGRSFIVATDEQGCFLYRW